VLRLFHMTPTAPWPPLVHEASIWLRCQREHTKFKALVKHKNALKNRTVAVLHTDGPTIIAGGKRDLDKLQRGLLREGEIGAKRPGSDAEVTVLLEAKKRFLRPRALATTRTICPDCAPFTESRGGILTSDTTAVFPPF